jgi:hypothetical protein
MKKGGKDIAAAGLKNGQPLFQSVNSLETAVTGRAAKPIQYLGRNSEEGKGSGLFTPVAPGGQPVYDLPGERRTARARSAEPAFIPKTEGLSDLGIKWIDLHLGFQDAGAPVLLFNRLGGRYARKSVHFGVELRK